jgi:hypothetical protein
MKPPDMSTADNDPRLPRIVADAILRYLATASPGYPTPPEALQKLFGQEYDRRFYPQGVVRQLAALIANGDRRPLLRRVFWLIPSLAWGARGSAFGVPKQKAQSEDWAFA